MPFEEILMEKASIQKFDMFRHLKSWNSKSFTINDLSRALHLTYQQTYNIFQELLRDMAELDPESNVKRGRHDVLERQGFRISIDHYRVYLLQQSIAFQFLDYLLQQPHPTITQFCDDYFVSRSTLLRKTTALKKFVGQFGLKFSYSRLDLTGSERNIRLVLFYFYWLIFHGLSWPFKNVAHQDMIDFQEFVNQPTLEGEVAQAQEVLMLGICVQRIQTGHLIESHDDFQIQKVADAKPIQQALAKLVQTPLTPDRLAEECHFIYFVRATRLSFALQQTQQSETVYHYFEARQDPIWHFMDYTMTYFAQRLPDDVRAEFLADAPLKTNLLRLAARIVVIQQASPDLVDFTAPLIKPEPKRLGQLIDDFLNQLHQMEDWPLITQQERFLKRFLLYFMLPYARYFRTSDLVRIRLLVEDGLATRELRLFLGTLNLVDLLPINQTELPADLVITTFDTQATMCFKTAPEAARNFYWPLNANDGQYFALRQCIRQIYTAKNQA
ncbi:helix-turn-helix domain-containing protein [Loigolactobacillus bifermentans]|uniref:Mga helix-turn-helix domain-containing protein n=1 Tax=Loigolactobacillus bifermentans DSM 20003 TaxID=1423726 RepID=A0A0R1GH58_9LACO|nr:helix-turn-helix domain-containing protein [Loigolactobacillus bifermentans]KRK33209.1 hypothetical protein FC07_GL001464 [Loigolactobacillus bifermentans DSM 20003]QGG60555.1 hypothetical protein LB003_08815 [Loigolactobacillus bifermentans]